MQPRHSTSSHVVAIVDFAVLWVCGCTQANAFPAVTFRNRNCVQDDCNRTYTTKYAENYARKYALVSIVQLHL